ncbi:hypothetical protein GCM10010909_00110 [Acidocella aquatica]|uniref:BrnA antitoxin of type II toxin-antitoxin system n=1 Tax=Acidocella aquatica TaxID=1922313 RepID=A0ABQ5ZYP3_9PROT|nr:hypothetical protein [Acidocella aquatica]GLR65334.1 hypothetical protein GCM10010909_00110 [Acidocella aquatica]
MADDAFGFAPKKENSTLAKLAGIKPSAEPVQSAPLAEIDEAGRRAGFTSREPGARLIPRRRKAVGPTITINTRVPEDIAERFIQFCDQNRLSYWEGIEELMNRAKI